MCSPFPVGGRRPMDNEKTQSSPPEYGAATGSESWWDRPYVVSNGRLLMNVLTIFLGALAIGTNIGMVLCRR